MNKTFLVTLMLLGSHAMAAAMPENPESETDPAMMAFYESQCEALADENKLQDEAREAFLSSCAADMPQIWPVGQDDSE